MPLNFKMHRFVLALAFLVVLFFSLDLVLEGNAEDPAENEELKHFVSKELGLSFDYSPQSNIWQGYLFISDPKDPDKILEELSSFLKDDCANLKSAGSGLSCEDFQITDSGVLNESGIEKYYVVSNWELQERSYSAQTIYSWVIGVRSGNVLVLIGASSFNDNSNSMFGVANSMHSIYSNDTFLRKDIPLNIIFAGGNLTDSQLSEIKSNLTTYSEPLDVKGKAQGIRYDYQYNLVRLSEGQNELIRSYLMENSQPSKLFQKVQEKSSNDLWINQNQAQSPSGKEGISFVDYDYKEIDAEEFEKFLYEQIIKDDKIFSNAQNIIFLNYDLDEIEFLKNFNLKKQDHSTDKKVQAKGMMSYGGNFNFYFLDLYSIPWKDYDFERRSFGFSENFRTLYSCKECIVENVSFYLDDFLHHIINPYSVYRLENPSSYLVDILVFVAPGSSELSGPRLEQLVEVEKIRSELQSLNPYVDWEVSISKAKRDSRVISNDFRAELSRLITAPISNGGDEYVSLVPTSSIQPWLVEWAQLQSLELNLEKNDKVIPVLLVMYDSETRIYLENGAVGLAAPDSSGNYACCVFGIVREDDFWKHDLGATDLVLHELGHVMSLSHPFDSQKQSEEFSKNNFWNWNVSPMTYAAPFEAFGCGYFSKNFADEPCGIVGTLFTPFEKQLFSDRLITSMLKQTKENLSYYKQVLGSNADSTKINKIESLVNSAISDFNSGADYDSALQKTSEVKAESDKLSQGAFYVQYELPIKEDEILIHHDISRFFKFYLVLSQDAIYPDSPMILKFFGEGSDEIELELITSDYNDMTFFVSPSQDGKFDFSFPLDMSYAEGKYVLRVESTVYRKEIPFIVQKSQTPAPKYSLTIQKFEIPTWIKNNAEWWATGTIGDNEFTSGIQFLIKEDIIKIPDTFQSAEGDSHEIPSWVKNNADWWAQGLISDNEFLNGIQYMVKNGIIKV